MATVSITIKDTEAGLVDVRLDFTPPQAAALDAVESLRAQMDAVDE